MRITSQSLPKPWESKIQSPPTVKDQKTESPEAAVDTFAATAKDKHEFPLVGAALLTLTAVAGFATSGATTPQPSMGTEVVQIKSDPTRVDLMENPDDWKEGLDGSFDTPIRQETPQDSGYENPDDWKEELGGQIYRGSPGRTKSRSSSSRRTPSEPTVPYDGPDAWKAELGGHFDAPIRQEAPRDNGYENPDDWKEELGGEIYRGSPARSSKSGSTRQAPSEPAVPYDGPDAWKEGLDGHYDYDSGQSNTDSNSYDGGYDNPDDWKSKF